MQRNNTFDLGETNTSIAYLARQVRKNRMKRRATIRFLLILFIYASKNNLITREERMNIFQKFLNLYLSGRIDLNDLPFSNPFSFPQF